MEALYYEEYLVDFSLETRNQQDITITVNVSGLDEGESASLSIRQPDFECAISESEFTSTTIETDSAPVENGSYPFTLPADTYDLVAYTADEVIERTGINLTGEIDVAFTPTP